MKSQDTNKVDEARLTEAVNWQARLADESATEADWLTFTDWLESHERNPVAYDAVEDMALVLDQPTELLADAAVAATAKDAGGVSGMPGSGTVINATSRFLRPQIWAGIATAAAAVWLAVVGLGTLFVPEVIMESYETGKDNTQQITLNDGTTVHMNINSKLEVTFVDDARRTRLSYGEALFTVAKEQDRPFIVAIGDRDVRVVGTVFNVLRHGGSVTVTVAEGIVDVTPSSVVASDHSVGTERLTAGQRLNHTEGMPASVIVEVDADMVGIWRTGYLEYDEVPLAVIVADLNRYFATPIQIEDDIGALRFSGALSTDDQDVILELLASVLPIEVLKTDSAILLKRKNKD